MESEDGDMGDLLREDSSVDEKSRSIDAIVEETSPTNSPK